MISAIVFLFYSSVSVSAQQTESHQQIGETIAQTSGIAGPERVAQKIKVSEAHTSFFPQPSWLKLYDGWKKHPKDDYGLSFGSSAY
jgi:hypothetical protein